MTIKATLVYKPGSMLFKVMEKEAPRKIFAHDERWRNSIKTINRHVRRSAGVVKNANTQFLGWSVSSWIFPTQASKTSAKYTPLQTWKNLFIFAGACQSRRLWSIEGKKLFAIAAWGDRSKCGKGLRYPLSLACTFDKCAFLVNSKSRAHWECLHNDSCGVKFAAVLKCMGIMVIGKLHKVTHAVVSGDTRNGRESFLI